MRRLFISALHKSSGKTMLSVGVAAAFAARGMRVQPFKKGPDYIDPMWLARASGRACYNLDFNTQSETEIRETFARAGDADIALIEGNKGLHDGVDLAGADSSAALAKLLGAPVVLVVDTIGMTRGIAPMLLGYKAFDPAVNIAGIILNKVGSPRQASKLRQAVEHYTDIPILGAVGRDEGPAVEERHLGLTTPAECPRLTHTIQCLRAAVERGVDLDRLWSIADAAATPLHRSSPSKRASSDLRIAVARDKAFGFYYADDLEALEQAGASLTYFDALQDARLPPCDGLFIGGGFPETNAALLAANGALREDIRTALRAGLPAYAECGGLMYLARSIRWRGETHEMVGVVPADVVVHDRPQGRGLVLLEETAESPWPASQRGAPIRAHEFHYAGLENVDPGSRFAYRMQRGFGSDGVNDGFVVGNLLASFSHLRDTAGHRWAERFVAFVRGVRDGRIVSAAVGPRCAAGLRFPDERAPPAPMGVVRAAVRATRIARAGQR